MGNLERPILEKDGPFSYQGLANYRTGNFKKVPIIIGYNSEELISVGKNYLIYYQYLYGLLNRNSQ